MLAHDALLLALLTGLSFGVIVGIVGSSWQRLALLLATLYVLQTLSQQLFRVIDGIGSVEELVTITIYRLVFAVAACIVVYFVNRKWGPA